MMLCSIKQKTLAIFAEIAGKNKATHMRKRSCFHCFDAKTFINLFGLYETPLYLTQASLKILRKVTGEIGKDSISASEATNFRPSV